ncbi:FtsX-like permease family protein [Plantibacter sp. Mn2098]|uniref:FtsX-like permease family protein n=1 Tax=Plantibacter sp. Mn2098 TaxID=3395266 RepID=UPI003BEBD6C0
MIALAFSELRLQWRLWMGMLVMSAASAAVLSVGMSIIDTGLYYGGEYRTNLAGGASVVFLFSGAAAIAVLASVADLTVVQSHHSYALWKLAGVRRRAVRVVVLVQTGVVGIVGAVIGLAAVRPVIDPVFHYAFGSAPVIERITAQFGALTIIGTPLATLAVLLVGSWRSAGRAARTPPLVLLRDPEPKRRLGWLRVGIAVLVSCGAAVQIWFLQAATLKELAATAPMVAPLLMFALTLWAPVVYPLVLRCWTAIVPAGWSSSWYLARHQTRARVTMSTAAITPLLVAVALTGGLYSIVAVMRGSVPGWSDAVIRVNEAALILGGPILLGAIGSTIVVVMTGRSRSRELALLRVGGAGTGILVAAAVWEAVIQVVSAVLLGGAVVIVSVVVVVDALRRHVPDAMPAFDVRLVGWIAVLGAVLVIAATVLPALRALRTPPMRQLGVE